MEVMQLKQNGKKCKNKIVYLYHLLKCVILMTQLNGYDINYCILKWFQ